MTVGAILRPVDKAPALRDRPDTQDQAVPQHTIQDTVTATETTPAAIQLSKYPERRLATVLQGLVAAFLNASPRRVLG